MTNKQKYNAIVEKINALEVEKNKIYQEMLSEDMSDKDKFHLIVGSGIHCNSIISHSYNDGVLDKMLDGEYYQKHETIYIDNINTSLLETYVLPTYEEQLEMYKFLDYLDDFTMDDYKDMVDYTYYKHITMEQFKEYVQDVIKGGVSSFEFDW